VSAERAPGAAHDDARPRAPAGAAELQRRLGVLADVGRTLVRTLDPHVVWHGLARRALDLLGARNVLLYRVDRRSGDMLLVEAAGDLGSQPLDRLPAGLAASGRAVRERRTIVTADVLADPDIRLSAEVRAWLARMPHRAGLAVPMIIDDAVLGVFAVGLDAGHPIEPAEVGLIEALAGHAAMAVRNAELYAAERRLRAEAELLASLAPELTGSLRLDQVLQAVAEAVRDIAEADVVRIALRDEADGAMRYRYLVGTRATGYERLVLVPGRGFVGRVLDTGEPFRTADAPADAAVDPEYGRYFIETEGVRTAMVVPVRGEATITGLLYCARRRPRPFADEDERIVCRLAEYAAVAIRNAQLHAEADRRRREAELLGHVLRQLSTSLELDTVLQRIVESARELCAADVAWITRPVGDGPAHRFRYMTGTRSKAWHEALIEPGRGMGGLVLATGQTVRTDDYRTDPRFGTAYHAAIESEGIVAQIILPIRWAERLEGLLYVSRRTARPFTDRDEALLARLADQASIVLHNVDLLAREQAARTEAEAIERRASFLAQASVLLAASLDVEAPLRRVARLAVPFLADFCAIDMADERGQPQRVVAVHVDPDREALVREVRQRYGFNPDAREGVSAVLATGRSAFVPHVTDEHLRLAATSQAQLALLRELRMTSWVIVPLVARGRVLGAITLVMAESGRRHALADLGLAEDLGRRAAIAIENAQLYRAAQLANQAKDQFLATLSHELRTPINAVYGWARMLSGERMDADTQRRGLEAIERNARAQVQLIDDLLDVSRIVTGKLRLDVRPVDVGSVIDAALDAVRPAADAKGVRLHTVLDPRAAPVMGDPDRLQQVVWNLLTNAVKFTPRGGRVEVTLRRVNSHLELVVADTGEGIEPALLPHLFERFRQGERAHGGLGIGLALVRHLAELHGGTVSAASEGPGRGASFTVRLPLSVSVARALPEPPGAALPDAPRARSLEGLDVLIVDDDPDALELLRAILGAAGASVRSAASAAEALKRLEAHVPDVVVSDVEMPGEDGYTLVRRLRQRPREAGGALPVVALTAYGGLRERVRALEAGFDMHIAKPADPVELTAVLARLVRRV
jgi:signal transduction histidine kinase/CheY-like chemotaxis protein/putative methionine-R-sulfoxide reductase with GAF domain